MSSLSRLRNLSPITALLNIRQFGRWHQAGYPVPLPDFAKRSVLKRYGQRGGTWVETGTYKGQTTAFLAKTAPRVISLEPAKYFYDRALKTFARKQGIEIINGTSENVFPELLPKLSGNVNFWLDGHFSAGQTFQGSVNSPLYSELAEIEKNLPNWGDVSILIDDIRHSGPMRSSEESGYPTLQELVAFSERNGLAWLIEHDIFVTSSKFPRS